MYSYVRQKMRGDQARVPSTSETRGGGDKYKSYRCMLVAGLGRGSIVLTKFSSLGSSRKLVGSKDIRSATSTCTGVQSSDV